MASTLQDDRILSQRPRLQEACVKLSGLAEQLDADEKLPTMVEMRDQLGISVQTLNDAVRELEKRDILRSVRGVGIYVAQKRRRLVTGNVGFVSALSMYGDYSGLVLGGMREAVSQRNCQLLLIDNGAKFERWEKIDGALLWFSQNPRSSYLEMPQPPRGLPCLTLFNQLPEMPCVGTDDFEGSYQLTRHLIKLGHRRIAYLAKSGVNLLQLEERKEGYLKALSEANIEPDPRWIRQLPMGKEWKGSYLEAGEYYTARWLEEDWHELECTALVAQNDTAALGAINAFQAAGMEVPLDVSVTGFDGLPPYPGMQRLTTVQVPLYEAGKQAMNSLLDWLADPVKLPENVRLPVRFVQGQTTARPFPAD